MQKPKFSSIDTVQSTVTRSAWPFYVVCDVSMSMWDPERWPTRATSPLGVMNDSIDLMFEQLGYDEDVAAEVHMGIITFSEEANVHYELQQLRETGRMDPLPEGTTTNYVAAWECINTTLRRDVERLLASGYQLKQPTIFFITDGLPCKNGVMSPPSEWCPSYDKICSPAFFARPLVVALGMGNVTDDTLRLLKSRDPEGVACIAPEGDPASVLLSAVIAEIRRSVRNSVTRRTFQFTPPNGWRRLRG